VRDEDVRAMGALLVALLTALGLAGTLLLADPSRGPVASPPNPGLPPGGERPRAQSALAEPPVGGPSGEGRSSAGAARRPAAATVEDRAPASAVVCRVRSPDGEALSGVGVHLRQGPRSVERVETDPAGEALFHDLAPGTYAVDLDAESLPPGWTGGRAGELPPLVDVELGARAEVELVAFPAASLHGVVRAADGAELASVAIRLQSTDPRRPAEAAFARTDERGRFVLSDLPPDRYRVQATLPCGTAVAAPRELELVPGLAAWMDLVAERTTARVRGRVTDALGRPLGGAPVVCEAAPPTGPAQTRGGTTSWSRVLGRTSTEADGTFELTGLPGVAAVLRIGGRRSSLGTEPTTRRVSLGPFDLARGTLEVGTTALDSGRP